MSTGAIAAASAFASSRNATPAPGMSNGMRSSIALNERGAHSFRYAIWSPVVESTRSAASSSDVSRIARSTRSPLIRSISSRIASMRRPLRGLEVTRVHAERLA